MIDDRRYAVLAGSGFQKLADESAGEIVKTRFGETSSPVREMNYGDRRVRLIARHGDAMLIPPHEINYRANLAALADCGVTDVIALNTVGVIARDLPPGELALPSQIIDYTHGRAHSIYGGGAAELDHIEFTEPLDAGLREELLRAAIDAAVTCRDGGVYAVTQGPRLESAAEVDRLERDGADYVGMTAMPEAALAMELGMRYACISLIVNYAAGRGEKGIHEDLAESTEGAKLKAMKVLGHFFRGTH